MSQSFSDFLGFFRKLFDTSDFPARWQCGNWSSGHGWLHILSDLGIWSAYVAIPCVLIYFLRRKRMVPFRKIIALFGAFILACGTTHFMDALIFWAPLYRLSGLIKLATAIVSWATVISLLPIVPQALSLRPPQELDLEIQERRRAEAELLKMRNDLERRVVERTAELTRTNQALQRSEERYRILEQRLSLIVWNTSSRGDMLEESPSWREFTGQSQEEARGYGWLAAVHPEDRRQAALSWNAAVQSGTPYSAEYRLRTASGAYRTTIASGFPVRDAEGRILEWLGMNLDVTEQRTVENALRDADRRKNQFLAMLGHELRNPLSGISGAIQVLITLDLPGDDVRSMLQIIERQSRHMARLIDDLLEVSRISRGKIQIHPERIDLAAQIRSHLEDLRPALTTAGLTAQLDLPPQPVWVMCDPTRWEQILMNLVQNAVKFTDAGGRIEVRLTSDDAAREAIVSVRDTGIGLAPELLTTIFQPFSQADSSLERSRGGLGLGLALVKGLVELHEGTISAWSAGIGQGTEFTLRFPLAEDEEELPEIEVHYTPHSLKILVIDDQIDAGVPLRRLLELEGHTVQMAGDGPSEVQLAKEWQPAAVLCDIGLPGGMDGYAVARTLRAHPPTRDITLIALTGYGSQEDRDRGLQAGFNHYLTKPADITVLRTLLLHIQKP